MDKINFILNNIPDLYNKENDSNLYSFLNPIGKELDTFIDKMNSVKEAKFVEYAKGNDLDKIASILNLKRFTDESDELFRSRIKSRVPSFIGGGTIYALKQVVNIYLGVEPVIIEHYKPGEGHPFFENGIVKGLMPTYNTGLRVRIQSGVAYINGNAIHIDDILQSVPASTTSYIKLNSNGTLVTETNNTVTGTQLLLCKVISLASSVNSIDPTMRRVLNPEENYITNTASITIQIPYNFTASNIPLESVKDILRNTKAAGIALLIKIMDTYEESIQIKDTANAYFLMGFSGIGGNNILGGK